MSNILPQDAPQKQCSSCKQFFPHTAVYFSAGRAQCKKCRSEKSKERYQNQRDVLLEKSKQYHQEHKESANIRKRAYHHAHKEEANQRSRKWHREHKEEANKRSRLYYHAHQDGRASYQMQYRQTNRERLLALQKRYRHSTYGSAILRVNALRRRVRRLSAPGHHSAQQLCGQLKRQHGKCYWCGKTLGKGWHADHIVPLSRGGSNDISNIVISCSLCNHKKYNKLPHEWPEGGRLL